jgi:hypothetical protein
MIFWFALPPAVLLDLPHVTDHQSPWSHALRLKKSIVLVCKTWNYIGIEFLYEDIALRRESQVPSLLRTLETPPRILGSFVKTITISALVSHRFGKSFSEKLQRIVNLCPRLSHFGVSPVSQLPDSVTLPLVDITSLEFNENLRPSTFLPILNQVSNTLLSLSLHIAADLHAPIVLPCLKSLRASELDFGALDAWSMPSLEQFTTTCSSGTSEVNIQAFCKSHGKFLQFIDLAFPAKSTNPTSFPSFPIQKIADVCPCLEHIVLRNWTSPPLPSISHPRIKWVDLCDCELNLPDWDDCFYVNYPWKLHSEKYRGLSGLSETLPALEGVRMLMQNLPRSVALPRALHPSWANIHADLRIQHPGISIRCERGFLFSSMLDLNGTDCTIHSYRWGYDTEDGDGAESESDDASDLSVVSEPSDSTDEDVELYAPEILNSDSESD